MNEVPGFIGFKRVSVDIRVASTAKRHEVSQTKRDLLVTGAAHPFGLAVVNVAGFSSTSYTTMIISAKDDTPDSFPLHSRGFTMTHTTQKTVKNTQKTQ